MALPVNGFAQDLKQKFRRTLQDGYGGDHTVSLKQFSQSLAIGRGCRRGVDVREIRDRAGRQVDIGHVARSPLRTIPDQSLASGGGGGGSDALLDC